MDDASTSEDIMPTDEAADQDDMDTFWQSPQALDGIEITLPWANAIQHRTRKPNEAPGLRHLGRPMSWKAPQSPESALEAQYASAQRRADEVLRAADEVFEARRLQR